MTNKPVLTRIVLEYADGRTTELVGDMAVRWLQAVNEACSMSAIHGAPFPRALREAWKPGKDVPCDDTTTPQPCE